MEERESRVVRKPQFGALDANTVRFDTHIARRDSAFELVINPLED